MHDIIKYQQNLSERGFKMLTKCKDNQLSIYSSLYNKIPKDNILKLIKENVDFSFINVMLQDSYCINFGRPAKEPELMLKLELLKYLFGHSDESVIEAANLNLGYLYFLDLNPEDSLPHPSLLCKFRTLRLKDNSLDDVLTEIVRQCVEKGIIKSQGLSIDATHILANTQRSVPEALMKELAKNIFKEIKAELETIPDGISKPLPDDNDLPLKEIVENNKIYLEELFQECENDKNVSQITRVKDLIKKGRSLIYDSEFLSMRGQLSLVDEDARVGHKTREKMFFGYKTEFTMLTGDNIITAVSIHDAKYVDGTDFNKQLEQTAQAGIKVREVYADKAYFRAKILDTLDMQGIESYIPVSATVYKMDQTDFTYNKDSDEWFCPQGNQSISKKKYSKKTNDKKTGEQVMKHYVHYRFDSKKCKNCSVKQTCLTGKEASKRIRLCGHFSLFEKYAQRQKTEEFKEKFKVRSRIEAKNAELKRFHKMTYASGYGLRSMQTQVKLTILAVNMKRIAQIIRSKTEPNPYEKTIRMILALKWEFII